MGRSRLLVDAVRAVLALILVEAVISILARWPHQFGGSGDPHRMLQQFAGSGTALAPPLFIIRGAGNRRALCRSAGPLGVGGRTRHGRDRSDHGSREFG